MAAMRNKIFIFLVIALAIYAIHESNKIWPVVLVVPNTFEGYITIVEDKDIHDPYNAQAWENFAVLEYNVGTDGILRVGSLRHFLEWPPNIAVGREWVSPIVYYKSKTNTDLSVYSDLIKISDTKYRFWVGKRSNLP